MTVSKAAGAEVPPVTPGAYPRRRPRRLRRTGALRAMVRESGLRREGLVYPLFVCPGNRVRNEISSMPGCAQLSVDLLVEEAAAAFDEGVPAVLLFGIPPEKDERGTQGTIANGVVPHAVEALKKREPELIVWTDVCLCAYTSHGHCGILDTDATGEVTVDNDATLPLLATQAVAHARAGADAVAPSDMMDGRIGVIRDALDEVGLTDTAIVAYAAKYASAFYGPFRQAAASAPRSGDRRSYQMDPGNAAEALREVALDLEEGADIVMVKPALAYLDVIYRVKQTFGVPVAAYNVSGEFSMIQAAAERGWLDRRAIVLETLLAMTRAGADILLTYFAREIAAELG